MSVAFSPPGRKHQFMQKNSASTTPGRAPGKGTKPFSLRVFKNILLGAISIIAVLAVYFMVHGSFPAYFQPVDFNSFPVGKAPVWAANFSTYGFTSDSLSPHFITLGKTGETDLLVRLRNGPTDYSGITLSWERQKVISPDGTLLIRWRGGKGSFHVLVDLTVGGGPNDTASSVGTNYFVSLDSPHESWQTISLPFSRFRLNPVQRPGARVLEKFDASRITEVSFTFFPQAKGPIEFREVRFVWRSLKWASVAIIFGLILLGLFLWYRTSESNLMSGGRFDLKGTGTMARITYLLLSVALLAKIMSIRYSGFSIDSEIIYILFFVSILADEFLGKLLSGRIVLTLRYMALLALGFYVNFTSDPIQFGAILAIAFTPVVLYRSRTLLLGLTVVSLGILLTHQLPQLGNVLLPGSLMIGSVALISLLGQQTLSHYELIRESSYTSMLYAEVLENTSEAIFIIDNRRRIERANKGFERIAGCGAGDIIGREVSEFIRPDSTGDETSGKGEQTSGNLRTYDAEVISRDGEKRFVLVREVALNKGGLLVGHQAVATDITDRKRAEENLRQLNSFNEMLIKTLPFGISIVDEDGTILFMSEKLRESLGGDLVGKTCWNSYLPDGKQCAECPLRNDIEVGRSKTIELKGIRGGRTFQVNHTGLIYRGKNAMLEVFEDVTERKELENHFMQSQKLESLGTLASGIAHDFNNILGIILGHASQMEEKTGPSSELAGGLDAIVTASNRGAALVRQMLTFARKTEMSLKPISLNESVSEIQRLFYETFPRAMTISCELQPGLPKIQGNSTQVHQALLNLCVNARDAMSGTGTLTISTRSVDGGDLRRRYPEAGFDSYELIEVSDTGTGMDEESLQHIFEPFYTTKELGKGTGLGLAVVFGIMEHHEGFVDVDSEPNKGTTFKLYFPVKSAEPDALPEAVPDRQSGRGSETVLVVEDEEALRELATDILTASGYKVLAAADGVEGIERFEQNLADVSLVVSDLGMPRMTGKEVLVKVKKMKPSVRFIIATGFLEPDEKSDIFRCGAAEIIPKPYTPRILSQKVRQVLDA